VRGFALAQVVEVGHQADEIAAANSDGEIGPTPSPEIDPEAAWFGVGSPWVLDDILLTLMPPARKQLLAHWESIDAGRSGDMLEVSAVVAAPARVGLSTASLRAIVRHR
jgi:hypothetical protein